MHIHYTPDLKKNPGKCLDFQLTGPLIRNLSLTGYADPVTQYGQESLNQKSLQALLIDIGSAISDKSDAAATVSSTGQQEILNDGLFHFEKAAVKLSQTRSVRLWDLVLEVGWVL